jgi:hypothetical protein
MAALGRKAGPMRHRLEPRGGSKIEEWEYPEENEPVSCTMRQPVDSDGSDVGGPLLDSCPRPAIHGNQYSLIAMCDWHTLYYERFIGPLKKGS